MKTFLRQSLFYFVSALFTCFVATTHASTPLDATIAPMLQSVLPAVVNIKAQIKITDFATLRELQKQRGDNDKNNNNNNDDQQPLPSSYVSIGTGVILDAKSGFIVTNAHVVNDAQKVIVTLSDGRHFNAKIIGLDKPSDIALLQIKAKNLTEVKMGDSGKLKVGDFVAAIGNPYGLNQSVTSGIVSALGRTTLGIENYENFIQTDAPINSGNSGGALINMQGQLVGINTAIFSPSRGNIGIGFAIPITMVKSVVTQLVQYGDVKRGVLGIGAQDVTPELADAFNLGDKKGAVVTQVLASSPAQQAGIQVGDIITNISGNDIKNASDVVNTIGFLRVDSKATISLLRHDKKIDVNVTLYDAKKRTETLQKNDPYFYGVGLKNFTLLSPVHGNVKGILVVSLEEDSNAWQSDLRPGDVITSVNQQTISNIAELKAAVAKADGKLLLNVLRGPGAIFLVITKES